MRLHAQVSILQVPRQCHRAVPLHRSFTVLALTGDLNQRGDPVGSILRHRAHNPGVGIRGQGQRRVPQASRNYGEVDACCEGVRRVGVPEPVQNDAWQFAGGYQLLKASAQAPGYRDQDLVFARQDGPPLSPDSSSVASAACASRREQDPGSHSDSRSPSRRPLGFWAYRVPSRTRAHDSTSVPEAPQAYRFFESVAGSWCRWHTSSALSGSERTARSWAFLRDSEVT